MKRPGGCCCTVPGLTFNGVTRYGFPDHHDQPFNHVALAGYGSRTHDFTVMQGYSPS